MLQQIHEGINEQSEAARHILKMVGVINSSAHAIMTESKEISTNGDTVYKNMVALSDASKEILNNTHLMVTRLDEIKDSASIASYSAALNLELTQGMNELIDGYKTK